MTEQQEAVATREFARDHPTLHKLGFDGVRLYPDWAYLVLAGVLILWGCSH